MSFFAGFIERLNPKTGRAALVPVYHSHKKVKLPSSFDSFANDELLLDAPYPVPSIVERKRFQASQQHTTYIYDFIHLYQIALENQWKQYPMLTMPKQLLVATELSLDKSGQLVGFFFANKHLSLISLPQILSYSVR
jgi:hypothetical protein